MAEQTKKFSFISLGMPGDTFGVVRFTGNEGLSQVYHFDVQLICKDHELDLNEVIQNPARFSILREEGDIVFNGILIEFEQMHQVHEYSFYRAVLVPKMWWLSQTTHNQIFLGKSVPQILEDVLKDGGLTEHDFEMRLKSEYENWEYVCQYRETHLDFVQRWMEREGMYFYFEQTRSGEKLIITDTKMSHTSMAEGREMYYSQPSGLDSLQREEVIKNFCCRQKMLPRSLRLKDYNYERPSFNVEGIADVYAEGRGEVYMYGDHFKSTKEGNRLAGIRSEELKCWEKTFHGESTVPFLRPGYRFLLREHYRPDCNQNYLTVELGHEGSQAGFMLSGLGTELSDQERKPYYWNSFTALPADVQFRPKRRTEKPRFYGSLNARIDAAGSGKYAEVDEQGRYKVILPFDRSGRHGGKASTWLRMMQPYAGPNQGMHFPLHKGTEVLLTFVDGDPDRPIIAGAVPNPETRSPVNSLNQNKSVIKTGKSPVDRSAGAAYARAVEDSDADNYTDADNYIEFDDTQNDESIVIQSRNAWSRHGKNGSDPGEDDVSTTHADNTPEKEKTTNTCGIKLYTDRKLSLQANEGHEQRIVGRSIDIARDEIEVAEHSLNELLITMENFAPENVYGYDEKEVPDGQSSDDPPEHFPETYEIQPVPEPPEIFRDYFQNAYYETYVEDDGYTYYYLKEGYDGDCADAWEEYWKYWICQNKGSSAAGKEFCPYDLPDYLDVRYTYYEDGEGKDYTDYLSDWNDHLSRKWDKWAQERRSAWKKWQPHIQYGHTTVSHRDTFNMQEGNIYDFGGYWNYNLGNCYVEEHLNQHAELNASYGYDLLGAGGPDWYAKDDPWRTVHSSEHGGSSNQLKDKAHSSSDGWKNIWVEKHFGDAYEYTEGSTISVTKGSSQEIQIGGRHVEEKYNGQGKKTLYSVSEKGKTEETKWCPHTGAMLSYSISQKAPNAVHSYDFDWSNTASASISFAASASFSLSMALSTSLAISMAADISITINPLEMDIKVPFSGIGISVTKGGDTDLQLPGTHVLLEGPGPDVKVSGRPAGVTLESKADLKNNNLAEIKAGTGIKLNARLINMFC